MGSKLIYLKPTYRVEQFPCVDSWHDSARTQPISDGWNDVHDQPQTEKREGRIEAVLKTYETVINKTLSNREAQQTRHS